ncbi:MAG: RNA polymerase factor sigma-54 [Flavobacteriaceae bacterium]|jgi:RNA polymerase sigma-54 factor|nr:RNA polymerase factor sigma-54 [Flavobacteriaceae bacterium]
MLKQDLHLKLSQKLSPQQIQLMKLIQLPTLSFEQKLQRELEENPALEAGKEGAENEDPDFQQEEERDVIDADDINIDEYLSDDEIPSYRLSANNYSPDDDDKQIPYASGVSFTQFLMDQMRTFTIDEKESQIARFLVGSIDETGYIRRTLLDIVDDLAFTENLFVDEFEVRKVLGLVQQLDPAGVGALDLQDCLMLQLQRKEQTSSVVIANEMITSHFTSFSKKHFSKLMSALQIDEEQLKEAIKEIEKLNPKPGASYASSTKINSHITPDFTILIVEGELQLKLNGRNAPELHVSSSYKNMMAGYKESKVKNKAQQEAVLFIKQKLDAAKWFIDAVKQRNHTLLITMNAILNYQKEFFLTGDEQKIRPMVLRDIASIIQMDISTVSRVANSKYVETPYGTRLIKSFFSEGVTNSEGEDVSSIEIRKALEDIINTEDKSNPLTDEQLKEALHQKGYPVARRTVAKYRDIIGAPVARLRKKL